MPCSEKKKQAQITALMQRKSTWDKRRCASESGGHAALRKDVTRTVHEKSDTENFRDVKIPTSKPSPQILHNGKKKKQQTNSHV